VLEGVSEDDLKSLEELLEHGNEHIPTRDEIGTINVNQFKLPAVIHRYKMAAENQLSWFYAANGVLLNNTGFVLMNYHLPFQLDSYSDSNNEEGVQEVSNNDVLLLYDPTTSLISMVKVLGYSKKHDITLGKINVPDSINIPPTHITKKDPEFPDVTLTIGVDPFDAALPNQNQLIGAGDFISTEGEITGFMQTEYPTTSTGKLNLTVPAGRVYDGALNEQGEEILNYGDHIFLSEAMLGRHNNVIISGNSGSPVYSALHELVGLTKAHFSGEIQGQQFDGTIFLGPKIIRNIIRDYITEVRNTR
jgi:hypothetical protein|tara:strand:- start:1365 stop:2279 length:915 start_codon:yes stop_codon:yes gene_type:complete